MTHSLREMAQLTLHRHIDMSSIDRARQGNNASIRVVDLILSAVALSLKEHPDVNATLVDGIIREWGDIHLGVAVALDAGLVVPVVRHADRLRPAEIGESVKQLAAAARSGSLTMADLDGATFTVTNLGTFGIDFFTPIINPPQVAILGIGRSTNGSMTLSLTIDHRALDGATGAQFLGSVAAKLETPEQLLARSEASQ